MQTTTVTLGGRTLPARIYDAGVVGTGCAGFNAADRLYHYGRRDIAIVTDHQKSGTSRNTGSDKQTYYKITLSGDDLAKFNRMVDALEDLDDVQNVYHNVELPDEDEE